MLYLGSVKLPQRVDQLTAIGTRFVGHTIGNIGLNGTLVFADSKDMHIDLELIQRLFVVAGIRAKTGKHNPAHRVKNNFVGMGGEKVLLLREVIANRDNRLCRFA